MADFGRVLLFNPDHLQALRFRGDAYRRRAEFKGTRRLDGSADFEAALKDYERLIVLAPHLERDLAPAIAACKAALPPK